MKKDYLEIGRAQDILNPKERILYRFFEMLPGLLSLITLSFAFLFSWLRPVWVAIFIIIFAVWWTLKIGYLSFHQISCFRRMKKNLKIDWQKKLKNFPWQDIYQLVILPMYKEGWEIIRETLESLKNCDWPKERMIVILAQEERGGEKNKNIANFAQRNYGNFFYRFLITSHPGNLPGEIRGKGSNVAFAGRIAKKLIDNLGISYEDIIISIFDIDTKVFPQYFLCLTYHYLKNKKSPRVSFQPIPVYHNNIWEAPAFSRVIATSNTFWQMMQQERPEQLVTYSSHSMPSASFFGVNFPKTVVSDDSRIFWKSFLKYDGNYRVQPLYYPVSMDVVMAEGWLSTMVNQYKQQRRWAWGAENIPYILYGFLQNKKISLKKKIFYSAITLEGFWSWSCAALLILFLGWLPLVLGGREFNATLFSYNLPRLTGWIMSFANIGMITAAAINVLFLPPRPKTQSWLRYISMILQWLFFTYYFNNIRVFPSFRCSNPPNAREISGILEYPEDPKELKGFQN